MRHGHYSASTDKGRHEAYWVEMDIPGEDGVRFEIITGTKRRAFMDGREIDLDKLGPLPEPGIATFTVHIESSTEPS